VPLESVLLLTRHRSGMTSPLATRYFSEHQREALHLVMLFLERQRPDLINDHGGEDEPHRY
jgi:hypothetical protein